MDRKQGRWFGGKGHASDGGHAKPAPVTSSSTTTSSAGAGPASFAVVTAREYSPEEQQLQAELTRTLIGRCDVLMRAATDDTRQSDVSMIVECLRSLDDSSIRQPPAAAQRALAVARSPLSSSRQLVAIFEQDPALTEALLQMANSSYYHRGNMPCVAISEAIQRVGVRGVEAIITTHMVEGLLCRPGSAYAELLAQVWAHMTRTAPIARTLAPAFKTAPETAFTVGLMHDTGRLMIFDFLSQLRARNRREIRVPDQFLYSMLNRLHEPLGGISALRWNLGADIARSIAYHHLAPPPENPDLLTELLCIAEKVDHTVRLSKPMDVWEVWRDLELSADPRAARELLVTIPNLTLSGPDGGKVATPKAA